MDSFTFDAVIIAAVLLLTVASMGGWFGEPTRRADSGHGRQAEAFQEEAFQEIAAEQGKTVTDLAAGIEQNRTGGLSAAIRVYIVEYYRSVISRRR